MPYVPQRKVWSFTATVSDVAKIQDGLENVDIANPPKRTLPVKVWLEINEGYNGDLRGTIHCEAQGEEKPHGGEIFQALKLIEGAMVADGAAYEQKEDQKADSALQILPTSQAPSTIQEQFDTAVRKVDPDATFKMVVKKLEEQSPEDRIDIEVGRLRDQHPGQLSEVSAAVIKDIFKAGMQYQRLITPKSRTGSRSVP